MQEKPRNRQTTASNVDDQLQAADGAGDNRDPTLSPGPEYHISPDNHLLEATIQHAPHAGDHPPASRAVGGPSILRYGRSTLSLQQQQQRRRSSVRCYDSTADDDRDTASEPATATQSTHRCASRYIVESTQSESEL